MRSAGLFGGVLDARVRRVLLGADRGKTAANAIEYLRVISMLHGVPGKRIKRQIEGFDVLPFFAPSRQAADVLPAHTRSVFRLAIFNLRFKLFRRTDLKSL